MHVVLYIFYIAVVFWWITELWIRIREKGSAQTGKDKYSRIILIFSVAIALCLGILLSDKTSFPIFSDKSNAFLIGAVLIFVSISFRIWSVLALGNFFRTTVMTVGKQKVITHGPYTFLRHPSYSGILLATIGICIGINNWLAFSVIFLCIFAGLSYRMNTEEEVLLRVLGKDYREYMKHTKKLIPFIRLVPK